MRILTFCALCALLPMLSYAQKTDEQAIRNVMQQQQVAWNNADISTFMDTYWKNDSLRFVGKAGVTYGWQQVYDNYKKNYPDTAHTGHLDFELLQIDPLSDQYYFVVGKWHLTRSAGDVGGYFTLLFRKFSDGWKIVVDHTS